MARAAAKRTSDRCLLGKIKQSRLESGSVYGYREIYDGLREIGESCGRRRVGRLMRLEGLRTQRGYRCRLGHHGGKPAVVAPDHLQRAFAVHQPKRV